MVVLSRIVFSADVGRVCPLTISNNAKRRMPAEVKKAFDMTVGALNLRETIW